PMEQVSRELTLTISDGDATLVEQTVALQPRTDERMLGVVASEDLGLSLPRRQDLTRMPFTAIPIAPEDIPDQAAGLGSLGILLIGEIPPESLRPDQISALLAWVHAGGHLIVGGGAGAATWVPAEIQPATVGAGVQISDAPLAGLADAAGPGDLPGVQLTPAAGGISTGPEAAPAWVARPFGKGKVTQLAFEPGLPGLRSWPAAPAFWDALLKPALVVGTSLAQQTNVDDPQERMLAGALTALPTVSQPPIDWFFIVLIGYTFVIGPLLALLLRRIDRQAWSWLMVPVIAVGSGSLLLALAINLRADDRVISQVSLVEQVGAGQARARMVVGMLAPQAQTLIASVPEGALVRPVRSTSGLYGSISGVSGPILQESASLPIRLGAWRLEGLLVDQIVPLAEVSGEVTIDAEGAQVKVQNATDQRLVDVVAVYDQQVVRLGDLRPGDVGVARWPPKLEQTEYSTAVSSIILSDIINASQRPGQAPDRRIQIRQALIDAAMVQSDAQSNIGPIILAMMERSPLDVVVAADGAAYQSMSLLVLQPTISASGPIRLPDGWLRVSAEESLRTTCFSSEGVGVSASPAPATIAMHLPADLSPLRADTLTLSLNSTKEWPSSGVITELYDWSQGAWVEQNFDGPGDLQVASPQRYLSQGQLQLRLRGSIERANCLLINSTLQGTMP
ncbi:hypothetical protein K2Z83_27955, partial [Oscillochloris sp. ZM17-4]|uniref:hypothetical protein n=1 Tax=Oscillochloris sp. ZM17-4 TaxID=2866714 RepID=UPI001C73A5B2